MKKTKDFCLRLMCCFLFLGLFCGTEVFAAVQEGKPGETFSGEYAVIINTDTTNPGNTGTCSLTGHRHRRRTLKQKIMQSCRVEAMHRRRRQQRELRERQQMWGRYRVWRMISCRHTCRMISDADCCTGCGEHLSGR
mgnify:CR=1 FL=1